MVGRHCLLLVLRWLKVVGVPSSESWVFQRATKGDVEAWVRLLVARSSLTEEEVLNLTTADLDELAPKLAEATEKAASLMALSKQMGKAGS